MSQGAVQRLSWLRYNELAAKGVAHFLKHDSSHRRFAWEIRLNDTLLQVGDDNIRLFHQPDINALPWKDLGIDVVLDYSGVFGCREDGLVYLAAGAKNTLFPPWYR